jgi:Kef-type K+ transport system membrane component KefB
MRSSLLSTLLLLLVGALIARLTASRLARWAVPSIVLELLVGFVIGNTVLSFSRIEPLSGITELGVLTLFFQVGMEVRGGLLGSRPLAVIRTVLLSALTPLLAWWLLQQGFGLSVPTTLLFLAVLSATGTGVTLRALAIVCKLVCGLGISPHDRAAGIDRRLVVFGLIPRGLSGLVFATTGQAAGLTQPSSSRPWCSR